MGKNNHSKTMESFMGATSAQRRDSAQLTSGRFLEREEIGRLITPKRQSDIMVKCSGFVPPGFLML